MKKLLFVLAFGLASTAFAAASQTNKTSSPIMAGDIFKVVDVHPAINQKIRPENSQIIIPEREIEVITTENGDPSQVMRLERMNEKAAELERKAKNG